MKLITPGNLSPALSKNWWIGRQIQCDKCGYTGELEAGDQSTIKLSIIKSTIINMPISDMVTIACPTAGCPSRMYLFRSGPHLEPPEDLRGVI